MVSPRSAVLSPPAGLSTARRMALFYAAGFLLVGIQTPFWPVWLSGRGFGPEQIALIFAAAIWAKVVATPALGALADRLGRRRAVMLALSAVSLAAYAGLWPVAGFGAVLVLNLVAGTAQSALMPLGDAVTLAAVREEGADYGRIRLWGSITFIIAAAGSGAVLASTAPSDRGGNAVLVLVLAAALALLLACLAVPQRRVERRGGARWAALARLATDRRFWLFTAAAAMLQSSHQLYYGFGTLYWRTLGFSDAAIGGLWAEGVVAEIVLFWYGGSLAARLGPLGLMALGGAAGIVRWSLIGILPGLPAAVAVQWLHALTFGASHLGAMYFMARTVPPAAAASAQSLYAGLSTGIGSGLVMLAAGRLYGAFGGEAYLFMAALSVLGLAGVAALAVTRDREAG
jgi:PPP family 3-phenylpropionic acid transporter